MELDVERQDMGRRKVQPTTHQHMLEDVWWRATVVVKTMVAFSGVPIR